MSNEKDNMKLLLVNKYRIFEVSSMMRHINECMSYQKELHISFRNNLEEERSNLEKELDVCVRVFNNRLEKLFLNKCVIVCTHKGYKQFGFVTEIGSNGVIINHEENGHEILCFSRKLVRKFIDSIHKADEVFYRIFEEYINGLNNGIIIPIGFDGNGNIIKEFSFYTRNLCDYLETLASDEIYR